MYIRYISSSKGTAIETCHLSLIATDAELCKSVEIYSIIKL